MSEMTFQMAEQIRSRYVCARCYGHLLIFTIPGSRSVNIECANQNCNGAGFVTKFYAEQRRSDSIAEKWEALDNLGKILKIERRGKSADEVIKELYDANQRTY